jgi:hypothetical protein
VRRFVFPLIALLGLLCAGTGLWFGGLRNETDIAKILSQLPRSNDAPFFRCADSFYWVSYAREMIDTGEMRVRFTKLDNAPYGRPNLGWASLNAWYLVVLAKIWSLTAGLPLRPALLSAALWASPILYLLTLTAILLIGWRMKNFPAAAAAVLIFGTAPRVYDDFGYAVPGHHGWHDLACFAMLICLAAAIRKFNSQRWFVAAGLSGAIAMWIGVTQQAFGLAAAGVGALVAMLVCRFTSPQRSASSFADKSCDLPAAEGWRVFGLCGAIAALSCYLIEYAPGPFAMRLEVNHPIYALGFLLGGEFLCRAQRLIFPANAPRRSDLLTAIGIGSALATILTLIFFGPAQWHTMRQPFIQRLHQEIAEFQPIVRSKGCEWIVILGTPISLVVTAIVHTLGRDRKTRERVALLVCALPCTIAIALSFVQLRWAGIAGASGAGLAAVLFADLKTDRNPALESQMTNNDNRQLPRIPILHAACIGLSVLLTATWSVRRNNDNTQQVRAEIVDRAATMEVAGVLQTEAEKRKPIVIFSDQKIRQAWIGYVTGIAGVGSLYWDNPSGIRDEAEFLATYNEETAHQIARAHGITYVVTTPNGGSVVAYHYMWQGNKTSPQIRRTLAYRLAAPTPSPPSWLELVPTAEGALAIEGIRVYRVL